MPEGDGEPGDGQRGQREQAGRREPLDRAGGGPEADEHGDDHDDGDGQHRLDDAADDVAGRAPRLRAMAIVRNRAMMPSVMSMATEIAVPWAAPATVISRIPGTTYAMYSSRPPAYGAEPGPERAAEDVHEQEQEDDRDAGDEEGQRRVAAHPPEVAPQHRRRVGQDIATKWSSGGSPSRCRGCR